MQEENTLEVDISLEEKDNFHGRVFTLQDVFANDYYAESTTDTKCTDQDQECDETNQWNNTLLLASKTKAGSPEKCICLWRQNPQEETAGSEYCPVMNIKNNIWREGRNINSGNESYSWCVEINKQGNDDDDKAEPVLCEGQTNFSLGVDEEGFEPITSQQQCQDYMERNYPETEFTTYHETKDKVECKGYKSSDQPTLANVDPTTGWSTLSGYHKKAGIATMIGKTSSFKDDQTFARADSCTDGGSISWKRYHEGASKHAEIPAGWPGSCDNGALFDGNRENLGIITGTCKYPEDTIPTREQAQYLSKKLETSSHLKLVTNYCFSPETDPANIHAQYDSIPKALSSNVDDRDLCTKLGKHSPEIYDQAAINYCTDVYDRYKDVTGFDFSRTGCQCIIDTKVNPDPALISIVTSLETHPSCVWKPCLIAAGGDQLAPVVNNLDSISSAYGSTTDHCPPLPTCSNILAVTDDSQQIDSGFNQSVQCDHVGGDSECQDNVDCPGDAICNTLGLCIDNCANVECETGWSCNESTGQCQLQTDRGAGYSGNENQGGDEPNGTGGGISTTIIIIIIVGVVLILGGLIIFWLRKKKNQKAAIAEEGTSPSVVEPGGGAAYRPRRIY